MKRIDTINWKEFKVGDLFEFERGKVGKLQSLHDGSVPVIAAARSNQGVAGYYDIESPYSNQITISCNGVGCGSTFYHNYPFNVNGDAIVLKEKVTIPEKARFFISCMLDGVFTRKYSYAEKCSPKKASKEIIKLPIDSKGSPDWVYMEEYIKNVEDKIKGDISLIINVLNGGGKLSVNTSNWKRFKIGDILPNIVKPKVYHTYEVREQNDGIPYIVRSKFNNGMKYRVQNKHIETSPAGVISFGAENSTFFYQTEEWCSGRDIYYIDTREIPPYACRFLIACLHKVTSKYSYSYGLFPDLLKEEYIKLPVDSSSNPDWVLMNQYMLSYESKAKVALYYLNLRTAC